MEFDVTGALTGLEDQDGSYSTVWLALGFSSNPNMVTYNSGGIVVRHLEKVAKPIHVV